VLGLLVARPVLSNSVLCKLTRPTVSNFAGGFYWGRKMKLPTPANQNVGHKLLTFHELQSVKGIPFTRRHIDRLEDNGDFPVRVAIRQHRVAWVESEIDAHLAERLAARPARKRA